MMLSLARHESEFPRPPPSCKVLHLLPLAPACHGLCGGTRRARSIARPSRTRVGRRRRPRQCRAGARIISLASACWVCHMRALHTRRWPNGWPRRPAVNAATASRSAGGREPEATQTPSNEAAWNRNWSATHRRQRSRVTRCRCSARCVWPTGGVPCETLTARGSREL